METYGRVRGPRRNPWFCRRIQLLQVWATSGSVLLRSDRLVEEEHATGGPSRRPRSQDRTAAADDRGGGGGVVRRLPGRSGGQGGDRCAAVRERGDAAHLDGGGLVEVREQPRQSRREHRLAGARRPDEE